MSESNCGVGDLMDYTIIFLLGWIIGVLSGFVYGMKDIDKE